ncbi:hypothetical protein [Haematomicrobium sanguinis]|uniref:antitoxin VbhA family protein n=1 Tax=Haematomicrobium sanguinis TaxID=479106 RepID=UPI0005515C04|nr:hypothetical protein [Haematomicrobium sanguinis]
MKELDLEGHWPELLDSLDDKARHEVRQILAANWHEGWVPNSADVAEIVKTIRGDLSVDEQLHSESATNSSTLSD